MTTQANFRGHGIGQKTESTRVDGLIEVYRNGYGATAASLVMGSAKFVGPRTLEVHLVEKEDRSESMQTTCF
jgi:hypothetical protein